MDLNEDEDIKKYYCTEVRRKTFLCPWNRRCLLRRSFNEMIRNLHTSKSLQYDMYICAILQYCDSYLLGSDEPTPCSMAPWRKEPNQNTDNTTCSNLHQSIVLPQPHCDGYWKGPNCLLSHIKASTLRWMCWLRGEWQDLGGGRCEPTGQRSPSRPSPNTGGNSGGSVAPTFLPLEKWVLPKTILLYLVRNSSYCLWSPKMAGWAFDFWPTLWHLDNWAETGALKKEFLFDFFSFGGEEGVGGGLHFWVCICVCMYLIIHAFQQQGLQRILHNQPEPVCCSWPPSPSSGSQSSNFKSTSPSLSSTLLYYKHYVGWLYMPMILQFVGSKQWQWIALLLRMTTSNKL